MKKRIDWIDIYKGLAIIAVVLGHSGSPLVPYIYLFHMPAFIFISGYTFNFEKYNNIQDLVYEKFKRLIIPYFSFAFLFSFLQIILKNFKINTIFFSTNTKEIFNPFYLFNAITSINYTNPLSGATWFLIMIFETTILAYIFFKIQKKYKLKDIFLIGFLIVLFIFSSKFLYPRWPGTHMNYFLDLNIISIFFFTIGYFFKKYQIFSKFTKYYLIILPIIGLYLSHKYCLNQMDFPGRKFDSWYKVIFSSFSGIFFIYFLSIFLEKFNLVKKIFIYIGQKTLSILCLHFLGFKISFFILLSLGLYKIEYIQLLTPTANSFLWLPIVFISITISLLIDKLLRTNKITKSLFLGE